MLEDEHELSLGMLMQVKCIDELCNIIPVFHSYLHHINDILLLFNDIWKVIMIYPIFGINSAQLDFLVFFLCDFRGLNDVIMSPKVTGSIFLKGRRLRNEGRKKTETRGHNGVGPRGPRTWPRGTHQSGPQGSAAVDLSSGAYVLT